WIFVQLFSASTDDVRVGRRLIVIGPVLVMVGFIVVALTHWSFTSVSSWVWVVALVIAGAGVGMAFPHLCVAAMSSSDDPVEGAKAAAGVGTAELIANTISSTVVGMLVVLGGPGFAGSMAMGAGLAALAAIGIVTAVAVVRRG